ncbi:glutathione-dependent disulfide-bond oxidoreductase, partial [Escherichia coli]|nr:glutathione-dependent disulfide-bond oxidoreductase [Escherichia coli]
MTDNTYQPAKGWTLDKSAGGALANINSPVSGPTPAKPRPFGKHPLQLTPRGPPTGKKKRFVLGGFVAGGF